MARAEHPSEEKVQSESCVGDSKRAALSFCSCMLEISQTAATEVQKK